MDNNMEIRLRTIDNFLDVDQKQFAMSVIEDRAIPSVIDGFKPVQRKTEPRNGSRRLQTISKTLWATMTRLCVESIR